MGRSGAGLAGVAVLFVGGLAAPSLVTSVGASGLSPSATTSTSAEVTTTLTVTTDTTPCDGVAVPVSFGVNPLSFGPGQTVTVSGDGIWVTTKPNPDPVGCPLPVGLTAQVTVTLVLAPPGTPDPALTTLGTFALVDGDGTAHLVIPAGVTYRGPASLEFDVPNVLHDATDVTLTAGTSSPTTPAGPVTAQPSFTG
jgi:hypothetical protein